MSVHTLSQGARSAVLTMGTLTSSSYAVSGVIDLGAAIPLDVTFEVEADANGTPSGLKQLGVFAKLSFDNTNYGTGPETGSTATEEADLHWIGPLPMNDTGVHRKFFSLQGQPVARYLKIVVKNDCGVALTSGAVYMAAITGVTTA